MTDIEINKNNGPYFYEHTNGQIIKKPAIVVHMGGGPREYFSSPFVKRWWQEQQEPKS